MRVLVIAVGSRGDVAPFIALGQALRAAGHQVTIAAYGMFEELVRAGGLEFRTLPGDPRVLAASEQGQRWQRGAGGPIGVSRFLRLVDEHMAEVNAGILEVARAGTDVMLVTGQAMFGGYRVAHALGLPSIGLALQPMHPTGRFLPPGTSSRSLGTWGNRTLGRAAQMMGSAALNRSSKRLWAAEGLPNLGTRAMFGQQDAARWPVFYGFSPAVVPRPPDWREGLEVTGYWWHDDPTDWTPPEELQDFLDAGPPPVFVGFGSMTPADTDRLHDLLVTARRETGVRMVVQSGWAGLEGTRLGADDDVLGIGDAPHDWLFPRMAAVVHHAGAGTTAAGLRAGVPGIGVPLIIDQPFWADRLRACGVGPSPIPYHRLTGQGLAAAINDAVTRDSYRQRAGELARRIAVEDGTRPVVEALDRL